MLGLAMPFLSSLWSFMVEAAPLITAGTAAWSANKQVEMANESMRKQEKAQKKAEAKQTEADRKAETARLEALAKNQEDQNKFDFGVDSALAKRYADAAQKWSAGTGSMTTDEDDENPFYTRGLI